MRRRRRRRAQLHQRRVLQLLRRRVDHDERRRADDGVVRSARLQRVAPPLPERQLADDADTTARRVRRSVGASHWLLHSWDWRRS